MSSGGRKLRRSTTAARISVRFARLGPKYQALGLAMARYADDSGHFDQTRFTEAFEDADPHAIVDMRSLTGIFEDLLNNLTEMLLTAAQERQLDVTVAGAKPKVPDLLDAICADGGLTAAQANELKDLNCVRTSSSTPLRRSLPRRPTTASCACVSPTGSSCRASSTG